MNNLLIYYFRITILCLIIAVSWSCERNWDNPTDSLNIVETENTGIWIIDSLDLIEMSEDEVQLSWIAYPSKEGASITGYKIDKKIQNEEWELAYEILPANTFSFIDSGINVQKYDYTYRVYAFADTLDYYSKIVELNFKCGDDFYDIRDGNIYKTVQIGTQCWFKENLKYLPKVNTAYTVSNDMPGYFVYDYQGTSVNEAMQSINYQTYATLYNRTSAKLACPDYRGWHVANWSYLLMFTATNPGGALKERDTLHWKAPNTGATDSLGLGVLPGGSINGLYGFQEIQEKARFWDDSFNTPYGFGRYELSYNTKEVIQDSTNTNGANSIRCVKPL